MEYGVVFSDKEQAELSPVEAPGPLEEKAVRGRSIRTLISPGSELASGYLGTRFPACSGYAAVFQVEETGQSVEGLRRGDPVFCTGPHRSFQQVPETEAIIVPEGLTPEVAVLARLMGVTMTTLMTTTAKPGDRVLVSGAGPVGYLGAQIFRHAGFEVLVAEPRDERRNCAERSGIKSVFPRVPVEDTSVAGTIALVLECSGHEQAALDACCVVRKRGEVVLVGVPWRRQTELYAHELLSRVFYNYVVLRSGWEWELPSHASDFRPHNIFDGFKLALKWLAEGKISVESLISSNDPHEAQSVYQRLLHGREETLFVEFDWTLPQAGNTGGS